MTDASKSHGEAHTPELFRLLVETVEDYAIFLLDPDGHVLTWNAGARRLKQYEADEVIGRHFSLFYPPEDAAAGRPASLLREAARRGRLEDEGWRVRRDGTLFWADVVITALRTPDGGLQGFAKITRDLTDRRRTEQSERDARRAAEETNRLKDEFLATVSHELRTPLNVLTGTIWRLRTLALEEEDRRRVTDTLDRNVRMMTRLVEDLLDMSRLITGKLQLDLQPIELGTIVEAVVENVASAARAKSVRLRQSLSPAAGPILGDLTRLQQIVWNLLSNAVKFTDSGGEIEVRLARRGVDVVLQVRDTGRGIAPAFLPHVFERFTQADASATRDVGGLGLGLSVVKHLAEAHGGRVAVFSEGEGQGATFEVFFPVPAVLVPRGRAAAAVEALADQLPQLVGMRVLIVDDNEDARESVCAVLKHCGANVVAADSTAAALRIMDHFHPEILLADIAMPEDDGYALIRKVRTQLPAGDRTIPAAALTAFAGAEDRLRVLAAGYQMHLPKPVDPVELVDAVVALSKSIRPGAPAPS